MTGLIDMGWGGWMVDTFIYTGLLIALVLLLRRPVLRWCGPQVVYALWVLPFLRFVMPPIVLPAWMAPAASDLAATANATSAVQPMMVIISDPAHGAAGTGAAAAPLAGIAVTDLLLPLWIGGALIFIGWRVREYYQMRKHLLAEARPVGEAGKVRLVETPAVSGPVAFGIVDKVVALPPAFMAHYDIQARDMAIAHELAHHRGLDLVANIAAQPLLALHWFNPLAWWGWRAMRADQEAACDARVVAGRARSERAVYAQVIAGFAAGDHLALAAPMACPVLGEKSIIHRLRSLTMSDVSSTRRRIGIAAITTTALALPLTASITYAQAEAPLPPEPPLAPGAPLPPQPPLPPQAGFIETIDPDGTRVIEHFDDETGERHVIRYRSSDGYSPEAQAEVEEIVERYQERREERDRQIETVVERAHDHAERAVAMGQQAQERAEHARQRAEHARERAAHARQVASRASQFEFDCDDAGASGVIERDLGDGRRAAMVCEGEAYEAIARQSAEAGIEAAIAGIRAALQAIDGNPDIPAGERNEAVRGLREAIEELQSERGDKQRREAKLELHPGEAREVQASAIALRWQVRMVSPNRSVAPASIVPLLDENCDEVTLPTGQTVRA